MYDKQLLLVFHSLTKITGYESGGWWLLYLFSLFVVEIISLVASAGRQQQRRLGQSYCQWSKTDWGAV